MNPPILISNNIYRFVEFLWHFTPFDDGSLQRGIAADETGLAARAKLLCQLRTCGAAVGIPPSPGISEFSDDTRRIYPGWRFFFNHFLLF